jgi:ATP-dependent helicase/nuclease subunit B
MKREFLGWKRPPLHSARDWLLERYLKGAVWDLSNVLVVLPTSRACRRLLELLVIVADEKKLTLSPPSIETLGNLPELLYEPRFAFASDLAQIQAWIAALRTTPQESLSKIVPYPPAPNEHAAWRSLAKLIQGAHRELASDKVTFEDAARAARKLDQEEEAQRWMAMHVIARRYYETLDALKLWDRQTARLVALDKHEYKTDKDLILLAAADLNNTQRQIVDQVKDCVTILIAAPKELAEGFDQYGALDPEYWCESSIALGDEQIRVVNKPVDQAFAALERLSNLAKIHAPGDIVIGIVDDDITPALEASLEQAGASIHLAAGKSLAKSSPFRLLGAISDWLAESTARHLASLVRHPQVYAWLSNHDRQFLVNARSLAQPSDTEVVDLLTLLDECITDRLVDEIPRPLKNPEKLGVIAALVASVDALLYALRGPPRPLKEWAEPLTDLLAKLASADPPTEEKTIADWRAFADACVAAIAQWQSLDESLSPNVAAEEAIDLLCDAIETGAANTPSNAASLQLLGWLDLPLDDAPAAVVTGFNEGRVPSAVHGDVFLPNTLRVALKLTDNRRRLARDAYALRLLSETKQSLTLIAGRLDRDGNPMLPSRLLYFADPETTAARLRKLYARNQESTRPLPAVASGVVLAAQSRFNVPDPRLDRLDPEYPLTMKVTRFRDFLSCGYRFYLKEIEQLQALRDEAEELPPNRFGDFLHNVLSDFGKSEAASLANAEKIEAYLLDRLSREVERSISFARHPAFAVQLEQLRLRLKAFAHWQAEWRGQGWEIIHTEVAVGEKKKDARKAHLEVDQKNVELIGRIDRIDRNKYSGAVIVFDYKTSDEAKSPEKAHDGKKNAKGLERWKDLQLPLYQILAASLGYKDPPQLGYINIPKKSDDCGALIAKWDQETIAKAHDAAREIVRRIRNREFKLVSPPPSFSEDFSPICQDRTLQAWLAGEEGE